MTKIKIRTTIKASPFGWNVEIYGIYPCGHKLDASSFIHNKDRLALGDHMAMSYLFSTLSSSLQQSPCPDCGLIVDNDVVFVDIDTGLEYSAIYPILERTGNA